MNKGFILTSVTALFLVGVMIQQLGVINVYDAVIAVGWGIVPVTAIHVIQVGFCGAAWRKLVPGDIKPTWTQFFLARWIRESVASLLPVAQIGGEILGARTLTLYKVRGIDAAASIIADLTIEVITLFVFTMTGLGFLVLQIPLQHKVIINLVLGLLFAAPIIFMFLAVQRFGIFRWIERLSSWLATQSSLLKTVEFNGLHTTIQSIYCQHGKLLKASLFHIIAWFAGALEVWLILYFINVPITLSEALILESLGIAIRSAAFFLPGGLGAQEGGFMFLGTLFGLPPHVGLALSLIKRCRELLLGLPGLLVWQKLETRCFTDKQTHLLRTDTGD